MCAICGRQICMGKAIMTKRMGLVHRAYFLWCTRPICFVISASRIEKHVSQFRISLRDSTSYFDARREPDGQKFCLPPILTNLGPDCILSPNKSKLWYHCHVTQVLLSDDLSYVNEKIFSNRTPKEKDQLYIIQMEYMFISKKVKFCALLTP